MHEKLLVELMSICGSQENLFHKHLTNESFLVVCQNGVWYILDFMIHEVFEEFVFFYQIRKLYDEQNPFK